MAREITIRTQYGPPWGTWVTADKQVNVAELLRVSLFTQEGRVSFGGTALSMVRFVMGLDGIWSGRLRASSDVFTWQDSLRKGFAEELGLVLSSVVCHDFGWDGRGPHWADLQSQYWGATHNRPDLIFNVSGGGQIVGEAKGAVRVANPVANPPSAKHLEWISELETWATEFAIKWFLSAAWATRELIVVDVFDPGEPTPLIPSELIDFAVLQRETALFETAPSQSATRGERVLRGAWVHLPGPRGDEPPTSLFLGAVQPPLTERVIRESDDLLISAVGGVVVILVASSGDESPSDVDGAWRLVLDEQPDLEEEPESEDQILTLRRPDADVEAQALIWGPGEFMVLGGSTAVRQEKDSLPSSDRRRRKELLRSGELQVEGKTRLRFARAVMFQSPTAAANQVVGTSISGPGSWRFADGTSLRDRLDEGEIER